MSCFSSPCCADHGEVTTFIRARADRRPRAARTSAKPKFPAAHAHRANGGGRELGARVRVRRRGPAPGPYLPRVSRRGFLPEGPWRSSAGGTAAPASRRLGSGMAPQPPESVQALSAAGNESFRNGQFAEASALYSRALEALQAQGSTPASHFRFGLRPRPPQTRLSFVFWGPRSPSPLARFRGPKAAPLAP